MKKRRAKKNKYPIQHWSHSSLMAFLRNPLAWYKRYVELVRDTPSTSASVIGRAAHVALEYFYSGFDKDAALRMGLENLRNVSDFEIDFGQASTVAKRKKKRSLMEREYMQAVSFYLEKPPRHKVLGVEVSGVVKVPGIALPLKAISDLVVESRVERGAVDIVDHKFVASFSKKGRDKTLFVIQALFNYYMVKDLFGRPVRRFVVYECKKTKNADGSPQLRRYEIDFTKCTTEFAVFARLVNEATAEISRVRHYLPNPSDMFEGENSFDIYRLGLIDPH
jgi:hypothetical protein